MKLVVFDVSWILY